jgi:microcystin-dependent protein
MSSPYIGEIRMFGGTFAPLGWLFCAGQLLPIAQYDVLYTLLGTTYGGDGVNSFGLPDLRGRVPVHMGQGPDLPAVIIGEKSGVEQVTMTTQQMPSHTHSVQANTGTATSGHAQGNLLAQTSVLSLYNTASPAVALNAATVGPGGQGQPHDNMQPYLCISFIIATEGIFPSQG